MQNNVSKLSETIYKDSFLQVPTFEISSVNLTNRTKGKSFATERDEELAKWEVGMLSAIFFLAVFGNSCVLITLWFRRKNISRMHIFIMHLCFSDLVMAFFNIFSQLIWDITHVFYGGDALCRIVKFCQVMAIYLSTYVLVMTAIDRYQAICSPLSSYTWTPNRAHFLVALAYVISCLFAIPQFFIFSLKEFDINVYQCWGTFYPPWTIKVYVIWFVISVWILPSLIIGFAYGCICWTVWKNVQHKAKAGKNANEKLPDHKVSLSGVANKGTVKSKEKGINPRTHGTKDVSRAKMKTIKLTLVVVICYIICWSPFCTAQLWLTFGVNAAANGAAITLCMLLASLNSCTNPWIYLAFSGNTIRYLRRCCKRKRSQFSSLGDSETRFSSTKVTNYSMKESHFVKEIPSTETTKLVTFNAKNAIEMNTRVQLNERLSTCIVAEQTNSEDSTEYFGSSV